MSDQNEDKEVVVDENTPGAATPVQLETEPTTEATPESTEDSKPEASSEEVA